MTVFAEFHNSMTTLRYSWRGREHGGDDHSYSGDEGGDLR